MKQGFYIDVGANNPDYISNTKYFYERGWTGINIEPHPIMHQKLIHKRQKDINLNIGISTEEGNLTYYQILDERGSAGSTFDKNLAEELRAKKHQIEEKVMPVLPLSIVLREHLNGKKIDFMSIDTEKFDFEVIKSNDWQLYRPTYVMVETYLDKDEIIEFMANKNYIPVFKNSANTIFKDTSGNYRYNRSNSKQK